MGARLTTLWHAGFQLQLIEDLTQLITVEDAPAVFSLLEDKRPLFETDLMKEVLSKNSPVKLALLRACNQVRPIPAAVSMPHSNTCYPALEAERHAVLA